MGKRAIRQKDQKVTMNNGQQKDKGQKDTSTKGKWNYF